MLAGTPRCSTGWSAFVPLLRAAAIAGGGSRFQDHHGGLRRHVHPRRCWPPLSSDITRFVIAAMSVTSSSTCRKWALCCWAADPGQVVGAVRHLPAAHPGHPAGDCRCGTCCSKGRSGTKTVTGLTVFIGECQRKVSVILPAGPWHSTSSSCSGRGSVWRSPARCRSR